MYVTSRTEAQSEENPKNPNVPSLLSNSSDQNRIPQSRGYSNGKQKSIGQGLDVLGEDAFVCHGWWAPWQMKFLKRSAIMCKLLHVCLVITFTCHTVCCRLFTDACFFVRAENSFCLPLLLLWSLRCNISPKPRLVKKGFFMSDAEDANVHRMSTEAAKKGWFDSRKIPFFYEVWKKDLQSANGWQTKASSNGTRKFTHGSTITTMMWRGWTTCGKRPDVFWVSKSLKVSELFRNCLGCTDSCLDSFKIPSCSLAFKDFQNQSQALADATEARSFDKPLVQIELSQKAGRSRFPVSPSLSLGFTDQIVLGTSAWWHQLHMPPLAISMKPVLRLCEHLQVDPEKLPVKEIPKFLSCKDAMGLRSWGRRTWRA